jgi:hypothetical protein
MTACATVSSITRTVFRGAIKVNRLCSAATNSHVVDWSPTVL